MTKFRIRIGLDYQRYIDEERVNIKQFLDDVYMEYNSTIYKGSFCDNYNCQTAEGDTSYLNFDISMNAYSQYQLVLYLKCHDSICSNYNVSFFKSFEIMTQNFEIFHNASNPIKINDCFDNYEGNNTCINAYDGFNGIDFIKHTRLEVLAKLSTIVYEEKKGISRVMDYILGKDNTKKFAFIEPKESEYKHVSRSSGDYDYEEEEWGSDDFEEEELNYENEGEYFGLKNKYNNLNYNLGNPEEKGEEVEKEDEDYYRPIQLLSFLQNH